MRPSTTKEDELQAIVLKSLCEKRLDDALNSLHEFVDLIINDPRATSRVLSSPRTDDLCRMISEYALQKFDCNIPNINKFPSTVFVLSEIIEAGGHIELLKDYINLRVFPNPIILITDIFSRQNLSVVKRLTKEFNITINVAVGEDAGQRFMYVINFLRELNCQNIVLLSHHQDSTAISASLTQKNCNIYFIHHADHQFSLGVTCKEFIHIDLHNVGFMDCQHRIGIEDNRYWPIAVRKPKDQERVSKSFLVNGTLRTCSSGNYRKFEVNNYLYDYFEILPKIVSITGGSHIHIGELSADILNKLKENFDRLNVEWSKFVHIRYVPSIANELLIQAIDLYISSFPLAGAKTAIEAMSVGIPLLMHENYRARLNGCCDLVYPGAFVWRNEAELFRVLEGMNPKILEKHSNWSSNHFISFYSEKVLIEAINNPNLQDVNKIPKLRAYYPDLLQTYLEDINLIDSKVKFLSSEIDRVNSEWSIAVKLIKETQEQIQIRDKSINTLGLQVKIRDQSINTLGLQVKIRDQSINELDKQLKLFQDSFSWKLTRLLMLVKKILRRVGFRKSKIIDAWKKVKEATQFQLKYSGDESDFDEIFYCALYPDILRNGLNPSEHFRLHGKAEGRLGKAPPLDVKGTFEDFNADFETVIVASHEATLTGAPILAKNIIDDLSKRYNVIVILMGGGPLADDFYQKGVMRVMASSAKNNELIAECMMSELVQDRNIKFAITNTIESSSILPSLAKRGIPTVALIHEFASSVKGKEGFRKSCFWPEQVVFSSKITHENLIKELPELKDRPINILAQGKSSTQPINGSGLLGESRNQLIKFFETQTEECTIILGIGTIYYRKGVDLFIQCASHLKTLSPDREFVFVWIGKNVDDELGTDYSTYLSDQIKRNELENTVFFFDEMTDIEFAYKAADILLLTSRLDPLPNVAIDALFNGVPVLCFDKASGIADILKKDGLEDVCIAPFLDVKSMAEKLSKLISSEEQFQNTKQRCQNLAKSRFSMPNYVLELERVAELAASTKVQFLKDVSEIKNSGLFRFDYATATHWKGLSEGEIIAAYVRGWRSGIDLRKPMPGFHPGIYKEKHGVTIPNGDPFADFIREGCPSGPWSTKVLAIKKEAVENISHDFKVALHIHVFYPRLLNQILKRIEANKVRPDLFVSVPSLEVKNEVKNLLSRYEGKIKAIEIVPNQGRDIGPMLTLFGNELIECYDIIGHMHTKVSPHAGDEIGVAWSNFLLENLLGGDHGPAADTILLEMYKNPDLGLAFPDDPHPIGWDKNVNDALTLAERLKLTKPLEKNITFPVGTMFWARKDKLAPLVKLGFTWNDYPLEPLPIDGTILHAIERILPSISPEMKNLLINVPNVSR